MMWCDVRWCDVMWCDVLWCDVMWCNVKDIIVVNGVFMPRLEVVWGGQSGSDRPCDLLWRPDGFKFKRIRTKTWFDGDSVGFSNALLINNNCNWNQHKWIMSSSSISSYIIVPPAAVTDLTTCNTSILIRVAVTRQQTRNTIPLIC